MLIIERDVERWFQCLTEQEARLMVQNVKGSMQYGIVVSYRKLPEDAKIQVRYQFEKSQTEWASKQ